MGLIEVVVEAAVAIFIIYIFAAIVFPALADVTGVNPIFAIIAMILLAIGVIAAVIKVVLG